MNNEHPITPPPELVREWHTSLDCPDGANAKANYFCTLAARWGADQELEECCGWLSDELAAYLRDRRRRPKPPSLKEQALKELKDWTDEKHGPGGEVFLCEGLSVAIIRRALEQLND